MAGWLSRFSHVKVKLLFMEADLTLTRSFENLSLSYNTTQLLAISLKT